jgi:hypothetical protein
MQTKCGMGQQLGLHKARKLKESRSQMSTVSGPVYDYLGAIGERDRYRASTNCEL